MNKNYERDYFVNELFLSPYGAYALSFFVPQAKLRLRVRIMAHAYLALPRRACVAPSHVLIAVQQRFVGTEGNECSFGLNNFFTAQRADP